MDRRTVAGLLAAVVVLVVAAGLFVVASLDGEPGAPPEGGPGTATPADGSTKRPVRQRAGGPGGAAGTGDNGGRYRGGVTGLLHRSTHRNVTEATMSFGPLRAGAHGVAEVDGELLFGDGGDEFLVRLAPDDRSFIADLGPGTLEDVAAGRVRIAIPPDARDRIAAVEGHVYAVRSRDADTDRISLFRVESLVARTSVRLAWVDSRASGGAAGPSPAAELAPDLRDRIGARLAELSEPLEAAVRASRRIGEPADVVLQIRTGAQGGNESRVVVAEPAAWYRIDDPATEAFDVVVAPKVKDRARGWASRSFVPGESAWVIEGIDVFARADGDANGPGEIAVRVAGKQVFWTRDDARPFLGWYEGRAVVRPGEEKDVILAAANSSAAEVRLHGRLVPLAEAPAITPAPFHPAIAPAGAARAAGDPQGCRTNVLLESSFRLVIASGVFGGDELRTVTLAGGRDRGVALESGPFDADRPVSGGQARRWSPEVRIPVGRAFVVTKVTWRGRATGEDEGKATTRGGARIAVGKTAVLDTPQTPDPLAGEWNGRVVVPSGHEDEFVVAVGSTSALDVLFEGELQALDSGRR